MSVDVPGYKASPWGLAYHRLPHDEALGAGSAGPGKSWVLLADPFQQILVEHCRAMGDPRPLGLPESDPLFQLVDDNRIRWGSSHGWAVHLRRLTPMLKTTVKRAREVLPQLDKDVRWERDSSGTITAHFRSGYRYMFTHCKDRDGWGTHQSNEYCVAHGTPVEMADGSSMPIEGVRVGDMVMTLEGPRRVTATHQTGRKPCVEAVVRDHGAIVGIQRHPTTHPVLLWPTGQSPSEQLMDAPRSAPRARPHGMLWQDYESLLCGLPESPVKRASVLDGGSAEAASGRSPLDLGRLPSLTVPVVLHGPTAQRAASRLSSATGSGALGARPETSKCSPLDGAPLPLETVLDRVHEWPIPPWRDHAGATAFYGDACVLPGPERPSDFQGGCFSYPGLRGEPPPPGRAVGQGHAPPPVGAGTRSPTCWREHDLVETPPHTPCSPSAYPHFYTGESRSLTEECRRGMAHLHFAGWSETYDLTVDGANHYITSFGLVNANTHVGFDESNQFTAEQVEQISTRLRTADPVLKPMMKIRHMSNPTMIREAGEDFYQDDPFWLRKKFVDAWPAGKRTFRKRIRLRSGKERDYTWIYLPARLQDNPDPEFVEDYEFRLRARPKHIRKALLEGDWYTQAGSYFGDAWDRDTHVHPVFKIPDDWKVFRSMDWGFKTHGCVHWWAIDHDGNLWCFDELTFIGKDDIEVAEEIRSIEESYGLWDNGKSGITGPADDSLWEERGSRGISKAHMMAMRGIHWVKADKRSRQRNAELLHGRLRDVRDGIAGVMIFERCRNLIRTTPAVIASRSRANEPEKGGEDHWLDSAMYACAYASRDPRSIGRTRTSIEESFWDEEEERVSHGQYGYGSPLC